MLTHVTVASSHVARIYNILLGLFYLVFTHPCYVQIFICRCVVSWCTRYNEKIKGHGHTYGSEIPGNMSLYYYFRWVPCFFILFLSFCEFLFYFELFFSFFLWSYWSIVLWCVGTQVVPEFITTQWPSIDVQQGPMHLLYSFMH